MSITYAMLKPDCIERNLVDVIKKEITDHGFTIREEGEVIVSEDIILEHYHEVIEKLGEDFKQLVLNNFVGKKVIGLIISIDEEQCIEKFRTLIGATEPASANKNSIRGKYSNDSYAIAKKENRILNNLIHASDSTDHAYEEIDLWFGRIKRKG